ncbi:MAG: GAF domain-containing protein [Chloroflexi bacterium]|nr:GAF domain-containing protein [Chloroflexota bacterium]
MRNTDIQTLERELAATQKALSLIQSIDRIRDNVPDPIGMLSDITKLLADTFNTEACLLMLNHRESEQLELKVIHRQKDLAFDVDQLTTPAVIESFKQTKAVTQLPESIVPIGLNITAVPIIMGANQQLGGVLMVRKRPFTDTEVRLLTHAEDHIDSAVMQGYTHYDMQQSLKEIETIYHIDHIRDQGLSFDEMLNAVVSRLEEILSAEVGFVMLYDDTGKNLEMRAVTHKNLFQASGQYQELLEIASLSLTEGKLICHNDFAGTWHSIMCLPLILNDRIIGVLGVGNKRGESAFETADQRLLAAIGSQMDTAIFESLEQKRLRRVLGRSVDPRVMERLLANPGINFLEGERRMLTVLYADVRGSTNLAEQTTPEKLVKFINAYLSKMTDVILAHEGTLDKFVGDEVMALFGAPFEQNNHPLVAVRAGLAMQAAHQALLREWTAIGGQHAPIGIGIATGEAIVGEMGSSQRSDYTAIGSVANLGARICSAAQGGQVLISPNTYELVKDQVIAKPVHGMSFKGIAELMTVYHVTGIRE